MQYAMQVFEYESDREFRTLEIDGEPWFVLSDVCRALDIRNVSDAAARLDPDEKGVAQTDTLGGRQNVRIINESGLFSLILRSDKPEAKRFKKWVTSEVLPSIRRTGTYGRASGIPAFIRRYNDNWDRVDAGHFSVLSELVTRVWGRLEMNGCVLADRAPNGQEIRIDVSVGRTFSDWLKRKHPTVSTAFSYYIHKTSEWEGEVRQYPISLLPLFIEFVETVWLPEYAGPYLSTRDPKALPHLPKLLPSVSKPKVGMTRRVTSARSRRAS